MTRTMQNRIKRRQARRQVAVLALLGVVVVGTALLVFEFTSGHYSGADTGDGAYLRTAGETISAAEGWEIGGPDGEIPPLSLGLGGDISFGPGVADVVTREGLAYPWEEISALFGEYDLTAASLEGPLCRGGEPNTHQGAVLMRGDVSWAAPMAAAGIAAVSLANDHMMDYGPAGLEETLNVLRAENVGAFGAGYDANAAEEPLVLRVENGASLALLSFCDASPAAYAAGHDSPGVAAASRESMDRAVRKAAAESPYVVVFMHWGEAGSEEITDRQRKLAMVCVRAGADLVVGSHPGVVQGIEVIDGVPVLYSLGNLVFSPGSEEEKNALFAGCRFAGGSLIGLELVALAVEGARPVPVGGERAQSTLRRLKAASPGVELDISSAAGTAVLGI